MILDALLSFSATAGDVIPTATVSTNIIDLGITSGIPSSAQGGGARDMGIGDRPALKLLVQSNGTFAGGTSLTLGLQGAPDNGSGLPGTFVTWWTSPAYTLTQLNGFVGATAALSGGARLMDMDMPRPPQGVVMPRFLQLVYTTAGTFTGGAGVIKAYIVLDRDDQIYNALNNAILGGYPPGIVIAN